MLKARACNTKALPQTRKPQGRKNQTGLKGRAARRTGSKRQESAWRSIQHPIRDIRYGEVSHGDWVENRTEADMACERRPRITRKRCNTTARANHTSQHGRTW